MRVRDGLFSGWWGSGDGRTQRVYLLWLGVIFLQRMSEEKVWTLSSGERPIFQRENLSGEYTLLHQFYFNITSTKWDVVADGACARVKVSVGRCASTIVRLSIDTCRVLRIAEWGM